MGKVEQGGGKAVLTFAFETLRHAGQAVPISSEIRSIANSKGQADVDENGNPIRGSRSQAKPSGVARAGGAIGGMLGGKKGAAVGAASRAAEAILSIDLASDGPSLTLAPGSRITLMSKSRSGPALASLAPNPAPAEPAAAGGAMTAATAPAAAPAPQAGGQPDLAAVKAEFVPGDKVIMYDDFSDMEGDEPPPHWKVRGGTAELRVGDGIRQLTMTAQRMTLTPNVTGLPANFTMETDVAYKGHGARAWWRFHDKAGKDTLDIITGVNYTKLSLTIRQATDGGSEDLTNQQIEMDWTKPVKQALWLQNGRMRYYVNGQRVMDVNQIVLPELGKIEVYIDGPGDNDKTGYVGFQFARFAESTPDFSKVLMSSGRYVTRGILFDTDSDRIKPESAPVIRLIAKGLEANPALKRPHRGAHGFDRRRRPQPGPVEEARRGPQGRPGGAVQDRRFAARDRGPGRHEAGRHERHAAGPGPEPPRRARQAVARAGPAIAVSRAHRSGAGVLPRTGTGGLGGRSLELCRGRVPDGGGWSGPGWARLRLRASAWRDCPGPIRSRTRRFRGSAGSAGPRDA